MRKITFLFTFIMAFSMMNAQNPGDLDLTFGEEGIVQTAVSEDGLPIDELQNIALQPDGKILACGNSYAGGQRKMAFVRYNEDGSIDTSFGDNGKVLMVSSIAYNINFVMDATVMEDGKIVICGRIYSGISIPVMIKMNSDGSMDQTFGDNGVVICEIGADVYTERMAIQDDGKVIFVGYYNNDLMAMRLNTDGSIDTTFGQNGFYTVSYNGGFTYASDVSIQEDGKIVIAGNCWDNSYPKWYVTRLNTDGSLDETFGEEGDVVLSIGMGNDYATALKIQNDGKILVGGQSWDSNAPYLIYSLAVVRLNEDGSMDDTFAQSGMFKRKYYDEGENYVTDLVVSESGDIYVAFRVAHQGGYIDAMGVCCIAFDGKLREDFGEAGFGVVDLVGTDDTKAIALQEDGKVILSATCGDGANLLFTLARFHGFENEDVIECTPPSELFGEYVIENGTYGVKLTWSNAREYRTLTHYNVYRSADNSNYELIAEAETTEYFDELTEEGTYYYQVTAFYEEDGETCESEFATSLTDPEQNYVVIEVTSVAENVNTTVAIYPNPIQDVLNINYEGDFNVQIIDVTGRVVFTAENSRSLNLSSLESGNYIIKVVSDNETLFNRFVKL